MSFLMENYEDHNVRAAIQLYWSTGFGDPCLPFCDSFITVTNTLEKQLLEEGFILAC